ncbi:unnamed protein product [Caenorhabditis nigoni]
MRVTGGDSDWIQFLLKFGDGSANDEIDLIKLEDDLYTTRDLIEEAFGVKINKFTDLSESATLTPKHVNVEKMNEDVHNRMDGVEKVFYSRDEVPDDSNRKGHEAREKDFEVPVYCWKSCWANSLGSKNRLLRRQQIAFQTPTFSVPCPVMTARRRLYTWATVRGTVQSSIKGWPVCQSDGIKSAQRCFKEIF